ncbi:MAG: ribonuclease P protein component [Flavobacteriales bacterium]
MNLFPKSERLHSKTKIDKLFGNGNSFILEDFQVYFSVSEQIKPSVSVLISVPKKLVPKAAERNKIKRLIREAYRINKAILTTKLTDKKVEVNIAFILLKSDFADYKSVEQKIKLILLRLTEEI